MANPEHVKIVKGGALAVATWRLEHPGGLLDLRSADFHGMDLHNAILAKADLVQAKLTAANLTGAVLDDADLSFADLSEAVIEGAQFNRANLSGTELRGTILKKCSLVSTYMMLADLRDTNLAESDLRYASLNRCWMDRANFTRATFDTTTLSAVSLASCIGLDSAIHRDISSIGYDTLEYSFRFGGDQFSPELKTFFLNAGVPKNLLEELPRIFATVEYCSCFICYGEPDLAFAQKLATILKARGVSRWLYALDGTPGERTWPEISRRRREAEKMIVVCSARTLVRDGALKEIEEQIDEEPDKMILVSLDDTWKEPGFVVKRGQRDLKPFLLDRNYADFGGKLGYKKSLDRLLKGLKRPGK